MTAVQKFLLYFGKFAASAILLVLVLRGIDMQMAQTRIASAAPLGLVTALACGVLQVVLGAWRWIVVTEVLCGVRMSMVHTTGVAGLGLLAGQVLPSTVGGDVVRLGIVSRIVGIGPGTRCVIADRVLGVLALGALAIVSTIGLVWTGLQDPVLFIPAGLAAAFLGATAVIVMVAPRQEWLSGWMAGLAAPARDLRVLFRDRRGSFAMVLSLIAHVLSIASFAALAVSISFEETALTTLMLFVSPALLISTVPVSIGGWGVRESAFRVGLSMVGIDGDGPVIVSVLFGLMTIAASAIASLGWFANDGLSARSQV